jgi:4-amino-4-deoxy-L-arabinose transferase-like glycosyltransferase
MPKPSFSFSIRTVFFLLAALFWLATALPEIAFLPLREAAIGMRAPETALGFLPWILGAGAVVFGAIFLAWRWIRDHVLSCLGLVVELPSTVFWISVLVCALVPRLIVAIAVSYEPRADAWWLHSAATSLAKGDGFAVDGQPTAYRPPGYPFLLSLTYRLFGPHIGLAWVWGLVSIVIVLIAVHVIAKKLYGLAVARIAVLLAATYPALILMTGQSLSDLPFMAGLLLLSAFVLISSPYRWPNSIVIGIAAAILTLTRGVGIGLFLIMPMIWFLRLPDLRKLLSSVVVTAGVFGICVAPWVLRNQAVFGVSTLDTHFGFNVYEGNHPGAQGGSEPIGWPQSIEMTNSNEATVDHEFLRLGMAFAATHPREVASTIPKKFMNLYLLETEAVTSLFQGDHPSPAWMKYALYGVSQFAYVLLLIAVCARAVDYFVPARRPHGAQWTGLLIAGYFTGICLIFHGEDRYRLPILPWFLIESALVLASASAKYARRVHSDATEADAMASS